MGTAQKTICFIFFMFVFKLTTIVNAQENHLEFYRVPLNDGLSQNTIHCIFQDYRGFLWFGTMDGLNRYDGYDFKIYKHDPDVPGSLSDNHALSIFEDRSGDLWIGTMNGLNRYDREKDVFTSFVKDTLNVYSLSCNRIQSIFEDRAGMLWIGTETGGLNKFDRERGRFTHYLNHPEDSNGLINNSVMGIWEDHLGDLWIGTYGGLDRFDRKTGQFIHYTNDPANPYSLSDDAISAIYEDRLGGLWIGTEFGLNRLNRENNTFIRYFHDPDDPHSISGDQISVLYEDHLGGLWIGTGEEGINKYDRENDRFEHSKHNPLNLKSLSYDHILSIHDDRSGILWVGTGVGLNKLNLKQKRFYHYYHEPLNPNSISDNEIWAILEDRFGNLWVGSESEGIDKINREEGVYTNYQHDPENPNSLSDDCILSLCEDRLGRLWIGTYYGGLNRFNRENETFTHYTHDPDDPASLIDDCIMTICEDPSGELWIGSAFGTISKFNPEKGTCMHYRTDNHHQWTTNSVSSMVIDDSGMLWIGTDMTGLVRFNPHDATFTHYPYDTNDSHGLSHHSVMTIHRDDSGVLWLGTGGGLNRFDPVKETFTHYRERDGLANDFINGILADENGNLWLSTNMGLSRFNMRERTFRNYNVKDGLQSNEFNVATCHKSRHGELFFGGINGFNSFIPDDIHDDTIKPPVVITDFQIANQSVSIGNRNNGGTVLERSITETEEIIITHRDRVFSFQYAALHYVAPEKNQYAYRMENFEDEWNDVGNRRLATYTNLSPGEYIFRVKASNNDGVWNEEGTSLRVRVIPPFWMTWWFRGCLLFLGLSLMFAIQQFRVHIVRKGKTQLELLNTSLKDQVTQRKQAEETIKRKLHLEKTISSLSSRFIGYQDIDEVINDSLTDLGKFSKASRVSLFLFDSRMTRMDKTHEWVAEGIPPQKEFFQNIPLERFTWWMDKLTSMKPIEIEDIAKLPAKAKAERELLKRQGVQSLLVFPLVMKQNLVGFIGFESVKEAGRWSDENLTLLHIFSQILGNVFERHRAEERVQSSLKEKEILLKEIHHRVKNNLQVISSLLSLQSYQIKDEQSLEMFRESQARVRSIAFVHEKLYQSKDFVYIDFGSYIRSLAEDLYRAYQCDPAKVALKVRVKDVHLGIHLAVPCGLILNELVSNALKYAFPERYEGRGSIIITIRKLENGEIELRVRDTGVGIPEDIDIRNTESLGLKLVTILVEDQLDGKVEVDRKKGTTFRIQFKG